jgi:hypothetical protein
MKNAWADKLITQKTETAEVCIKTFLSLSMQNFPSFQLVIISHLGGLGSYSNEQILPGYFVSCVDKIISLKDDFKSGYDPSYVR